MILPRTMQQNLKSAYWTLNRKLHESSIIEEIEGYAEALHRIRKVYYHRYGQLLA